MTFSPAPGWHPVRIVHGGMAGDSVVVAGGEVRMAPVFVNGTRVGTLRDGGGDQANEEKLVRRG